MQQDKGQRNEVSLRLKEWGVDKDGVDGDGIHITFPYIF
jgi:hypothetical protein